MSAPVGRGFGQTEILKWPGGRTGACSITYDGGTRNQFRVAQPMMDARGLPGTFFIVTGDVVDARTRGRFVGRPVADILAESANVPLTTNNLFERASALRYLGYAQAREAHTRAGDLFELGRLAESMKLVDDAFGSVRKGAWEPSPSLPPTAPPNPDVDITWAGLRAVAARGHEIASHSVSHPQFGITDDANLRFELEASRQEILENLGVRHTFAHECPHGSENPRVLAASQRVYPALRNRLGDPFLDELNRWNKRDPGTSMREYVQWQRGTKTSTPVAETLGWVDTVLAGDNIWLVLVFHGVDGVGYQPRTAGEMRALFDHLQAHRDRLWVATFGDVTRYLRERAHAQVITHVRGRTLEVLLTHRLGDAYDLPLSLRTRVPPSWQRVRVEQGTMQLECRLERAGESAWAVYEARPNAGLVRLQEAR